MDGPGEGDVQAPPVHGLGEAQAHDELRQDLRQAFGRGAAGGALAHRQIDPPGGVHLHQIGHRHPLGLGKSQGRGGWLAGGVKGHRLGGADDLLHRHRLAGGQILGHQGQTPGRGPGE